VIVVAVGKGSEFSNGFGWEGEKKRTEKSHGAGTDFVGVVVGVLGILVRGDIVHVKRGVGIAGNDFLFVVIFYAFVENEFESKVENVADGGFGNRGE